MKPVLNQGLVFLIVLTGIANCYGQDQYHGHLLKDVEPEVWNNPQVVLDVMNAYPSDSKDALKQVNQQNLKARTYHAMGQYDKSLEAGFKALQLFPQKDILESTEAAKAYNLLCLNLSKINLSEAVVFIPERFKISNKDKIDPTGLLIEALTFAQKGDSARAISLLIQAYPLAEKEFVWNDHLGISPSLLLFTLQSTHETPNKLVAWLKQDALDSEKQPLTTTARIATEQVIAEFYFRERNHKAAIEALQNCLLSAEALKHHGWQAELNRQLAKNYLATNSGGLYQQAINRALHHAQKEERIGNESINITQANLSDIQGYDIQLLAFEYGNKQKQVSLFLMVVAGLAVIAFLVYAVRISRTRELLQFARATTKYINDGPELHIQSQAEAVIPAKPIEAKPSTIPEDTEKLILTKLRHFESGKKFLSTDMSLAQLSTLLETNSKYVSEVINRHKGKNFNAYINELRIKYIVEKLHNNPTYLNYKVSYLAEESGFASHSSFTTVFKGVVGMSPARFIELTVKEKETSAAVS